MVKWHFILKLGPGLNGYTWIIDPCSTYKGYRFLQHTWIKTIWTKPQQKKTRRKPGTYSDILNLRSSLVGISQIKYIKQYTYTQYSACIATFETTLLSTPGPLIAEDILSKYEALLTFVSKCANLIIRVLNPFTFVSHLWRPHGHYWDSHLFI